MLLPMEDNLETFLKPIKAVFVGWRYLKFTTKSMSSKYTLDFLKQDLELN